MGNRVEAARAQAFAEAGVNRAILALLTTDPAERWVADGRIYDMAFVGQRVQVLIQDERGKIDLNTGTAELLRGLFAASGLTAEESDALTDAILDWRDEDDLRRLNGAEDADYRDAGLPYGAKNAPFDTVEELQQVLGMTLALFSRVEPALTVYSQQAGVDMTTAPAEVLRALPGMDPDAVEAILAARVAGAQQGAKSEPAVAGDAGTGRPAIGLAGRVYTVRARVRTEKGAVFIRDAIVRLTGNAEKPYWIHAWKQGRWENQADRETLPAANG